MMMPEVIDFSSAPGLWGQLGLCLAVIGVAGYWLSRFGSLIGALSGLSGSWVGFTLLAGVTTLPEMVTAASALTLAQAPDIAVGGLLGSTVFNLAILIVLEAMVRETGLYERASHGHLLLARLGTAMLVLMAASLVLAHAGLAPRLAHIGVYTPLVLVAWLVTMRLLFSAERQSTDAEQDGASPPTLSLRLALTGYCGSALAVIAAGSWLPLVAKGLAQVHGWEQSFVGTLLVAAVTSAPELAVTLSAARLGAMDMAIGNVLGANLLNVATIGLGDLVYTAGPLLEVASLSHLATALAAILMSLLFIAGLRSRSRRIAFGRVSVISLLLAAIYAVNAAVLYFGVWE